MEKYNFRFVDDPENQNVGLTGEEINFLQKELHLKFPEMYVFYLQNAGENSNVFQVETNTEELRKIQNELRSELDKLSLLKNEEILCIKKDVEFIEYFNSNFETYYFFNLSENKEIPELYYFEEVCINEGWLAFKKQISRFEEKNLIGAINTKTDRKYRSMPFKEAFSIIKFLFK